MFWDTLKSLNLKILTLFLNLLLQEPEDGVQDDVPAVGPQEDHAGVADGPLAGTTSCSLNE